MADAVAAAQGGGTDTAALLGPTSAGSQVALVLYGLYLALHVRYTTSELYSRLARRVKATLWTVFLLLTVYTALLFVDSTYWTTTLSRSPDDIRSGSVLDALLPLIAGLVQLPVQAILALRAAVFIPGRGLRYGFLGTLAALTLLALAGAILSTVSAIEYHRGDIGALAPLDFNYSIAIWLWTSFVVDIGISATLALTLQKRIGGFSQRNDSVFRKIAVVGYQTAAYTTVLALAGAATASAIHDADPKYTLVDWAFWLPLPACYGLSLYTTLSARQSTVSHHYRSTSSTLPTSTIDRKRPDLPPVVVPVLPPAHEDEKISTTPTSAGGHRQPHQQHNKAPRGSAAMLDKIETWERRASVDETRLAMPGLRRASSFDNRFNAAVGGSRSRSAGAGCGPEREKRAKRTEEEEGGGECRRTARRGGTRASSTFGRRSSRAGGGSTTSFPRRRRWPAAVFDTLGF
ncbi:hypothetical protein JCM8097_000142 [Rhodosporidiobolus ruineniae]